MDRDQREASPLHFDATGKVTLDHLYSQDDPRPYFGALQDLDYCIPQLAKPYFAKLIREHRETEAVEVPTVLDVGCSYGVNAALLRCDAHLDELYDRYGAGSAGLGRDELVARDRAVVRSCRDLDDLDDPDDPDDLDDPERARFLGLDVSGPALAYAVDAGLLDGAVHADLETNEATADQRAVLAQADLVISTGCVGYVGERTLRQVAGASGPDGRRPWMAHFVLRMFPYDPVAEALAELGYATIHVEGLFKQRRFASLREQSQVLDSLAEVGVDPRGLEAAGWLYAELFLSLPSDAIGTRNLTEGRG
jgi:carnitine O-acetyltransferase